jgi:hypothetical protein
VLISVLASPFCATVRFLSLQADVPTFSPVRLLACPAVLNTPRVNLRCWDQKLSDPELGDAVKRWLYHTPTTATTPPPPRTMMNMGPPPPDDDDDASDVHIFNKYMHTN